MQKLRWGLVGGGEGSQIGFTHRAAAQVDGHFHFDAGALDIDTEKSKSFGRKLGLTDQKSYGSLEEMLEKEKPTLVHSNLSNCEERIAAFRNTNKKWIVSVAMISEGVDIKRLRV